MNEIFERVKKLILSPKTEWETIRQEPADMVKAATYLLILALIPAVCNLIGISLFGYKLPVVGYMGASVTLAIRHAMLSFVSSVGGAILAAFVINMLARSFDSVQNGSKAFTLVVYAYVPSFVAGVFLILPSLSPLALLAGLYGLYLLYLGLPVMMETPQEKHGTYFIVSLLVMIAAGFVLSAILTPLFVGRVY